MDSSYVPLFFATVMGKVMETCAESQLDLQVGPHSHPGCCFCICVDKSLLKPCFVGCLVLGEGDDLAKLVQKFDSFSIGSELVDFFVVHGGETAAQNWRAPAGTGQYLKDHPT